MENALILVTGATGFVGTTLCRLFARKSIAFRPVTRGNLGMPHFCGNEVSVGDIDGNTNWSLALQGVETVVHLAARVHVMQDQAQDPLAVFRTVNVDGTLNFARQAVANRVKRFIFLSSIKVNGEKTGDAPFRSADNAVPLDPYGISKMEAEQGLLNISRETGLEIVIIRPPLVYGKDAKGNFDRLRWLATRGWPLPFKSIANKRSLIGVDNLCDCIKVCLDHPMAVNGPLLVSDNCDVSTPDLLQMLSAAAGQSIRLLPVSVAVLQLLAMLLRKGAEMQRLVDNLQVDCSEAMRLLDWQPSVSVEEGIRRSVV